MAFGIPDHLKNRIQAVEEECLQQSYEPVHEQMKQIEEAIEILDKAARSLGQRISPVLSNNGEAIPGDDVGQRRPINGSSGLTCQLAESVVRIHTIRAELDQLTSRLEI